MGLSWGVIIPLSVVTARNFKQHDPTWFFIHRAAGVLAFLMNVIGLGIGLSMKSKEDVYYG